MAGIEIKFGKIVPEQRFPPRKPDNKYSEISGLLENILPFVCCQFPMNGVGIMVREIDITVNAVVITSFR
jgi:hypothetical protein